MQMNSSLVEDSKQILMASLNWMSANPYALVKFPQAQNLRVGFVDVTYPPVGCRRNWEYLEYQSEGRPQRTRWSPPFLDVENMPLWESGTSEKTDTRQAIF